MDRVGRPEKLTDEMKRVVTRIRINHRKKWKAPTIREELRLWLQDKVGKEVTEKHLAWSVQKINAEVEERLPGLSSIQKYLKETKQNLNKEWPEDKPWHMGTLEDEDYELPPDSLPILLRIQSEKSKDNPLTIRQAKWVSRLYPIILSFSQGKETAETIKRLNWWSEFYADREVMSEVSNLSFNTSELDRELLKARGGIPELSPADELILTGIVDGMMLARGYPKNK